MVMLTATRLSKPRLTYYSTRNGSHRALGRRHHVILLSFRGGSAAPCSCAVGSEKGQVEAQSDGRQMCFHKLLLWPHVLVLFTHRATCERHLLAFCHLVGLDERQQALKRRESWRGRPRTDFEQQLREHAHVQFVKRRGVTEQRQP